MNCYYHKDKEAVGGCVSCGHLVCADCKTMLGEKTYCNACADEPVAQSSETETLVTKSPSWFHRHLNWTYFFVWAFLSWLSGYAVMLILALVLDALSPQPNDLMSIQSELILIWLAWCVGYLAVMIPVSVYVLRRKCRSLWWMLLVFSPMPFPMLLKDKQGRGWF